MEQSVTIKGTKSGIVLVLDDKIPFENLKNTISDKFQSSASFFGKTQMALTVRGRKLTDEEEREVLDIIALNTEIEIICVLTEDEAQEKIFAKYLDRSELSKIEKRKKELSRKEEEIAQKRAEVQGELALKEKQLQDMEAQLGSGNARVYKGILRSGQEISSQQNVVILGDVKPGSRVCSVGSIFVLGKMQGSAFAGMTGDSEAIVMALELNPQQVRIADNIAIAPDAEKKSGFRFRKKQVKQPETHEPEVACIEADHIVIKAYNQAFLKEYHIER
ncbi:MAG: septum site-determining protein MinC [Butyrivibrio sp.]|nr:septum site-determining protein MinC [Butyrivibrio sp.]